MLVRINEDGSRVSIVFKHVTQGKNRKTVCKIIKQAGEDMEVLSGGAARCSKQDSFSKEFGRMLSLTRALCLFDKEFRTEAWEAYWARGLPKGVS